MNHSLEKFRNLRFLEELTEGRIILKDFLCDQVSQKLDTKPESQSVDKKFEPSKEDINSLRLSLEEVKDIDSTDKVLVEASTPPKKFVENIYQHRKPSMATNFSSSKALPTHEQDDEEA